MASTLKHTMEVTLRNSTRLLVEAVGRGKMAANIKGRNSSNVRKLSSVVCRCLLCLRHDERVPTELDLQRLLHLLRLPHQLGDLRTRSIALAPLSITVCLPHLLFPSLEVEHSVGDGLRHELQLPHLGFEGVQLLQLFQLTSGELGLFKLFNAP